MKLKAAILALALLLLPAGASAVTEQQILTTASRAPACEATIGTTAGELNGHYIPARFAALMLGLSSPAIVLSSDGVSDEWAMLVLMHELGHCVQDAQGQLSPPRWEMEYDADRRGIELAYQLGVNPEFILDAFAYLVKTYRIDINQRGDHGTIRERLLHIQKVIRVTVPPEA